MLNVKRAHLCTVKDSQSETRSTLDKNASCWKKIKFKYKQVILPSLYHPKCIEYFKTESELNGEKRKQEYSKHSYIIHPFSKFRVYYELYMSILYMLALGVRPCLEVSSEVELADGNTTLYLKFLKYILEAICMPHVVVTFFTGYVDTKTRTIIMTPSKIATHYIKSMHFYVDLLTFFPRFIESHDYWFAITLDIWDLVATLSFIKLFTINEYLVNVAEYFGFHMRIAFRVLLHCCNVFICLQWLVITTYTIFSLNRIMDGDGRPRFDSWFRGIINYSSLETEPLFKQYCTILFLVCYLFFNCGYTYSMNIFETIVAIIIYSVGKICLVVITVIVVRMMLTSNSLELKYLEITTQMDNYMESKKFPPALKKRVFQYYDYKYQKKYFRESGITELLSEPLRREITREVLSKLVKHVRLFDFLPAAAVRQVIAYLKPELFMQNDVIIKDGTVGTCMYFISTGTVAVYTPGGREICHLQDNSYFGEISLIMKDEPRTATVVAVEICETYRLERKHFKSFFLSNPRVYEYLYKIAEDRIEYIVTLEELFKRSTNK